MFDKLWKECVFVWSALAMGFFLGELLSAHNYQSAFEHSFFAAMGLLLIATKSRHYKLV